MGIKGNNG